MRNSKTEFLHKLSAIDGAGIGVAIVMTLLLIFGLLGPLAMRDRQAAVRLRANALQRQHLNEVEGTSRRLTTEIAQAQTRLDSSGLRIRPLSDLNERLSTLVSLATENHVKIDNMKPGQPVQTKQFVVVPLSIRGSGHYSDGVRFMHVLHERLPDFGLDSFKLTDTSEAAQAPASFEMQMRWLATPLNNSKANDATIASTTP